MFLLRRFSIQSKLVLLLLLVSLGSVAVTAAIGFNSGRDAMQRSVSNQLIGLRESRADQLRSLIKFIRGQVQTYAEDQMVVQAMRDFRAAYRKLAAGPPDPAAEAKLREHYQKEFLPELAQRADGEPALELYLPPTSAARTLQALYLAGNPHPAGKRSAYDEAPDGSAYSAVHKKYHPLLRRITETFGYDDLMLIEVETLQIVYSVAKAPDFGTSLEKAMDDAPPNPYAQSNLGELARAVRKTPGTREVRFTDFELYEPKLRKPASFVGCVVGDGTRVDGILVLQVPIDEFNRVLSDDRNWERDGLGKTGDVYLVGEHNIMRSAPRGYQADPEAFLSGLEKVYDPEQLKRIRRAGTTTLTLPVVTPPVENALLGKDAVEAVENYRRVPVVCAYAPFDAEDYHWAIIAEMDADEAYGPVRAFGHDVGVAAASLAVFVSLLALLLASRFVRPIHQLVEGARQVSAGQTDVVVDVKARDEFGELADSFNEMTRALKAKSELIERQVRENEELLLNILPGPAAARLRGGEQQISETHADVSVLFAEVVGFNERTASLPADRALGWLNDLVIAFDEAAERHGVEKVKTIGASYLAACGLTVRRIDHTHRMVEFALDMQRIVRRFNQEHGTDLGLNVGINAGPVVGGVVGRTRFIYDLWGDTVNVARSLPPCGGVDTIRVTQAVRDRIRDLYGLEGPEEIGGTGKSAITVWAVGSEKRL